MISPPLRLTGQGSNVDDGMSDATLLDRAIKVKPSERLWNDLYVGLGKSGRQSVATKERPKSLPQHAKKNFPACQIKWLQTSRASMYNRGLSLIAGGPWPGDQHSKKDAICSHTAYIQGPVASDR
jgi:hypothetical protein